MSVLAYHLTWTTYGTWLPGDQRGWIKKRGSGVQAPDPQLEQRARDLMTESTVFLTPEQRAVVEKTICDHCRIRGWTLHAVNARTNHIHVVVTADSEPDDVMKQFKAWCSRNLSDQASLTQRVAKRAGRRHWFTEGGDKEVIEDEQYLFNAITYVMERQ
jgi:REP element-mobilizing transposase RayT